MDSFLKKRALSYLENCDFQSAIFYTERLLSANDNLENRLLLAKCYYGKQQLTRSYHILHDLVRTMQGACKSQPTAHDDFVITDNNVLSQSRYFLSKVCFELRRYDEAEEFLIGEKLDLNLTKIPESCQSSGKKDKGSLISKAEKLSELGIAPKTALRIPNGSHGLFLLGEVYRRSGRHIQAKLFYKLCLQQDSYHWGAISSLCDFGEVNLNWLKQDCFQMKEISQELASDDALAHHFDNGNGYVPISISSKNRSKKNKQEDEKNEHTWFQVLQQIAAGYLHLKQFQLNEALKYFVALPQIHRYSAFVLECIAKCFFEMTDYTRAIAEYKQLRNKYPYRMEGLDYYSTALWHMREAMELTLLAQHCSEMDKMSAETWVVMGNSYSQNKCHEEAIRRFSRAVSLDPHYSYAYTLQGHEHIMNENFEQAKTVFRQALELDPRHYNAWYGLGHIYHYQQQYDLAIYHFQRALEINKQCVLLHCCISTTLVHQKKFDLALVYVNNALDIHPANVRAKFQKANVLKQMNKFNAAAEEFESLLQIAPCEWKVYYHLAEVYKKIDKKDKALLCFDKAMELNPKDRNSIKQAKQSLFGFDDNCSDDHDDDDDHEMKTTYHSYDEDGVAHLNAGASIAGNDNEEDMNDVVAGARNDEDDNDDNNNDNDNDNDNGIFEMNHHSLDLDVESTTIRNMSRRRVYGMEPSTPPQRRLVWQQEAPHHSHERQAEPETNPSGQSNESNRSEFYPQFQFNINLGSSNGDHSTTNIDLASIHNNLGRILGSPDLRSGRGWEDNVPNAPIRQRRTRNDLASQNESQIQLHRANNDGGAPSVAGMPVSSSNNNNAIVRNDSPLPVAMGSDDLPLNFFATLMNMSSQSFVPPVNSQNRGETSARTQRSLHVVQSPNQGSLVHELQQELIEEVWTFDQLPGDGHQSDERFDFSHADAAPTLPGHHTNFAIRNNNTNDHLDDSLQSWSQRINLSENGE